ncbi:nucleotidyltransferase domain-containing protein [Streptomyces sp. NBC_00704]|uniref:nucleotidyltransferase domain-containing protein n=1 Tax=Streptomyces sp. NBC_00704 TaxID=2975809 RepID=UPI002E37504D|nr:nucleotidyltransferase domain-containing protein [Streptomyces sp. NBC_00704]
MNVDGERCAERAAGVSPQRAAEMGSVTGRVARWAAGRGDAAGLLLVGSCARGAARADSDVDLLLLSTAPDGYAADDAWLRELSLGEVVRVRAWGPLTEWRHRTGSGLEVELCVGPADWARTDPVDAGTRRVVTDGARPLYDPAGMLEALIRACG